MTTTSVINTPHAYRCITIHLKLLPSVNVTEDLRCTPMAIVWTSMNVNKMQSAPRSAPTLRVATSVAVVMAMFSRAITSVEHKV